MMPHKSNTIRKQRVRIILSSVILVFLVLGLSLWILASPQIARAATQTVSNINDSGSGSLRQAIADANPGDTIVFDNNLFGQTITLASPLEITQDLTIDGSGLVTPITVSGNDTVRVFHIYTDTVVTFDSLTIAHGRTTDPEPEESYPVGGGIKIELNAAFTLTHSTVFSNTAVYSDTEEGEYLGYGGGIYNQGELTVISSTFSDNTAATSTLHGEGSGGAIYNRGTLQVTNSTFSGNGAIKGGGIANSYGATLTVQNSLFSDNTAACGGAGIVNQSGVATVNESTIANNIYTSSWCEGGAAGIANRFGTMTVTHSIISGNIGDTSGGLSNYQGEMVLLDSTIYSNTSGSGGGGIYNWWEAVITITNSSIYNNTADQGGGIYNGPDGNTSLTLVNSNLFANTADNGGGIYIFADTSGGARMTLINSTLISNTATNNGGGIYNRESTPTLANAILWGNSAPSGSQIYNYNPITIPTISFSDLQSSGGSGAGWDTALGVDGGGNLDVNPQFVDVATGNLHLRLDSPVNDAGNNNLVTSGISTDMVGAPRFMDVSTIVDTGSGTPPIVDMGAYENGPALTLEKSVTPEKDPDNGVVTYTLALSNTGSMSETNVILTDTLPSGVDFGGWVSQPVGMVQASNAITWTGTINAGDGLTAIFTATINKQASGAITNTAYLNGTYQSSSKSAVFTMPEKINIYLPILLKQ